MLARTPLSPSAATLRLYAQAPSVIKGGGGGMMKNYWLDEQHLALNALDALASHLSAQEQRQHEKENPQERVPSPRKMGALY